MKSPLIFFIIFVFNFSTSQVKEIDTFKLDEFKTLKQNSCYQNCEIETFGNKNFIQFKRNDSTISMSYNKNGISWITYKKGNYGLNFQFHPNLKIKTKQEFIYGISQLGNLQIGTEKEYNKNGKLISDFNWENVPYDDNIPGPKKTIWEIRNQMMKDFNFDVLNDENLFSIHIVQNEKSKKVNYSIQKFISNENRILKLLRFEYDGETGKFIESNTSELEIPEGIVHY